MLVRKFRRASMPEAMAVVRAELGPEALILGSTRVGADIEVTAMVEHSGGGLTQASLRREEALAWHGVAPPLIALLAAGSLPDALARVFSFAPLSLRPDATPLLLAGPPGSGKTLTLTKLAARLVLGGVQPLIASADTRRAGASDQLAAFARVLKLAPILMSDPSRLAAAIGRRKVDQPVLIDTPGMNPFDSIDRDEFAGWAAATEATIVLVLPTGLDPAEAADCATALASLGATLLLASRLDVSPRLGGTLAAAQAGGLSLTEAGIGPRPTDGLVSLDPAFLARRLLHARTLTSRAAASQ